ncbi:MAG: pentapeptide repeat-containing protein [Chloroflexi bacterium]|nr:pentapeptide repeat-containing protein [Chloroflexota bacterium]
MDKGEALKLLKSDVAAFNEKRKAVRDPLDLSGADLRGASLKGADFRQINLNGASFQKADLTEAEFTGCILADANFQGANLIEANLHHANLRKADLRGSHFTPMTPRGRMCLNSASFEGTRWDRSHLEEILAILNQNRDWEIKYQIVPKARKD